jgi:hypothetical protein
VSNINRLSDVVSVPDAAGAGLRSAADARLCSPTRRARCWNCPAGRSVLMVNAYLSGLPIVLK